MFHRDALIDVGGFDPDWYHAEDMEVSLRLLQTGGVIVYTPTAVVHHVAESSLKLFLKKRSRDARAHMRIRRNYGRHGVRKPNGHIHFHDFVSDAQEVVWMLPTALTGMSLAIAIMCWWSVGTPVWWMASTTAMIWTVLYVSKIHQLLWSGALWYGAVLGVLDALFGRHGHSRIFSSKKR